MNAPLDKKEDIYRYKLMLPFKKKWDCYRIPIKASGPNEYDIIMASEMLGIKDPKKINTKMQTSILAISNEKIWKDSSEAVLKSLKCFTNAKLELNVHEYLYSILLANDMSPYTIINKGYCGDGGIPGYILIWLIPNEYTLKRLPSIIAHEVNHNVRYQFINWQSNVILGEMIVSEGLAENFATSLYGEEYLGPWVDETSMEMLNEYIKPIIHKALDVKGLYDINAYLYGDEMASLQGYPQVGLPYCAGYACDYYLIKAYLKKSGKSIVEATTMSSQLILKECEEFWNSVTKK